MKNLNVNENIIIIKKQHGVTHTKKRVNRF